MSHINYVNEKGERYPSATELTQLLPQPFLWAWYRSSVEKEGWQGWLNNKKKSDEGMEMGREVHSLIEGFIAKQPFEGLSGKYESQQIADALFDKVNPLVTDWIAIEPHVKSEKLKIHGTADAIVFMKGKTQVLDWKTSASKSNAHPVQLAIYALCYNEKSDLELITTGVIARVDKKSKGLNVKLDVYDNLKQYYPIVEALRTIWSYQNV